MVLNEKEECPVFDSKDNRTSDSTAWSSTEEADFLSLDSPFFPLEILRKNIENIWDAYVEQPHITT